jgi:Transposase
LALEVAKAGPDPEVVLEATYGWYWAADVLEAAGAQVHLAHPLGVVMFSHQRVKNDRRDATNLAELLRMGRLPEAWIAPPELRELRELVRYRAKLVALRSGLKAQVHAVLAKEGVHVPMTDLFGVAGNRLLDSLQLAPAFDARVRSLRDLIRVYDTQVVAFERALTHQLAGHSGYRAIQAIHGVGRVFARVVRGGDRRRHPLPRTTPVVFVGGVDTQASRVRHRRAARLDHQARIAAGALGRGRSGHPSPRDVQDPSGSAPHRGTPGHRHRQGRRGPQTSHARLLRAPRRRDSLPHPAPGGGVRRLGPQEHASSTTAMAPTFEWRGRALD